MKGGGGEGGVGQLGVALGTFFFGFFLEQK
jgi:hypothetical protein